MRGKHINEREREHISLFNVKDTSDPTSLRLGLLMTDIGLDITSEKLLQDLLAAEGKLLDFFWKEILLSSVFGMLNALLRQSFILSPALRKLAFVSSLAKRLSEFLLFISLPQADFVCGKNDKYYK